MKVAIHQPNFLPWLGFFAKIAQADVWVILDDVQFSRGSFTQRVRMKGPEDAAEWLTVPIVRTGTPQRICDVVVESWQVPVQAVSKVRHAYKGTSHGEDVFRGLAQTYRGPMTGEPVSLEALNVRSIAWISAQLGIKSWRISSEFSFGPSALRGEARLVEIVKKLGGTEYVSGNGGGVKYHDPKLWADAGIKWTQARFRHPTWPGMPEPGVSIVDLLARHGPAHAKALLEESIR